jgi:hypothetical protein
LAWGGWERSAERSSRSAYLLKNLQAPKAWVGHLVHGTIETFLKKVRENPESAGELISAANLLHFARLRFEREWEASLNYNREGFIQDPKRYPRLDPHFYGDGVACNPEELWSVVETCLGRFVCEKAAALLALEPQNWLEIESAGEDGAPPSFQFDLEGRAFRVYCVLDFSSRCGEDFLILDWKTGGRDSRRLENHSLQLGTYVMYAGARWQAVPEAITLETAYLAEPQRGLRYHVQHGAELDVQMLRRSIAERLYDLISYFDDPKRSIARRDNFEARPGLGKCLHCSFRGMCVAAPREYRTLGRL